MGPDSFPKKLVLRDGSTVTLLPLKPRDMEDLLAFYRGLSPEDRLVLRDDVTSPEWAERFHDRLKTGEVISLIARSGGKIVAEATLYRSFFGWTRHVGELRIATAGAARRKGLGTALAGTLVKLATDLSIEKIVIHIVDTQLGARRTFEKLGFHKEASLPRHIMDLDGNKHDMIIMANDVSAIWAAMEVIDLETPIRSID